MKKTIDCFLVGHNQTDFRQYEEMIRRMGADSQAYRDLNNHFLHYNGTPYTFPEIFDLFCRDEEMERRSIKPLTEWETFSAAVAYLGTYLHRHGFTFDYVSAFHQEKKEFARKLEEENILTIAITTTYYVSFIPIIEIIDFIRQHNSTAKIILGGPYVASQVRSLNDEELQNLFGNTIGADFYVNSAQGESALTNIIHALKNKLTVENIKNIYYRTGKGFVPTPVEMEANILAQNMVNWDLFADHVDMHVIIRTAISCPFSCSFCRHPEHAGRYQRTDIDALEQELDSLNRIESVSLVYFIDDTFNIPPQRFKEVLRMMIRKNYRFKWHSFLRSQFADEETAQLLKESGCEGVYMGLESGNNQVLKNMNKLTTVEKYRRGISFLKKAGINTDGNFIIGFPGETYESAMDSQRLVEDMELDFYRAQLWYLDQMQPIWERREEFDIQGERFDWKHATMDAKTACDLVDEIMLKKKKSLWIPHFHFNYDGVWRLVHRGFSIEQVKEAVRVFEKGLKGKLIDPTKKEIDFETVQQLRAAVGVGSQPKPIDVDNRKVLDDSTEAEFDF